MAGINRAQILGRLGQDPDVRFTQSGEAMTTLSIATSLSWKDKQTGEAKEKTEWHHCVCFGRTAEIARDYLAKGRQVYVEGRLQTRKWQSQDGQDRYSTEVICENLQLLGSRPDTAAAPAASKTANRTQAAAPPPTAPDFDDDITF
jgi:single-strand DNA-binding protein